MAVNNVTSQSILNTFELLKENNREIELKNEQQESFVSPSKVELEKITNSLNEFTKPSNTHLKFELHEKLNEYYVTIVDNVTSEVLKEIPSKKIMDIYASMTEFLGVIVDKKI